MDYKLEVVVVPVSDVDRAKAFYADGCGFHVDLDDSPTDDIRLIQLTPPGSACSISIGRGITDAIPGSLRGTQLVVTDIEQACSELSARGVPVGAIQHFDAGAWVDGKGGPWNSFARFRDPDGNEWVLQETPNR